MRTYLVTGGAGFIGSNYIHYMLETYGDSIRIINVDALTYAGNLENLSDIEDRPNYRFVKADITDSEAISRIFAENDIDLYEEYMIPEDAMPLCEHWCKAFNDEMDYSISHSLMVETESRMLDLEVDDTIFVQNKIRDE